MHLKQPSFTYSARWAYTKNKKEYKSLKKKQEIQDIVIKTIFFNKIFS